MGNTEKFKSKGDGEICYLDFALIKVITANQSMGLEPCGGQRTLGLLTEQHVGGFGKKTLLNLTQKSSFQKFNYSPDSL